MRRYIDATHKQQSSYIAALSMQERMRDGYYREVMHIWEEWLRLMYSAPPATLASLALSLARWALFRCAGDWAVGEHDGGTVGKAAAAAGAEAGTDGM